MSRYYNVVGSVPYIGPYIDQLRKAQEPGLLDKLKGAATGIKDAYVTSETKKVKSQIAKGVGIGAVILLGAYVISKR